MSDIISFEFELLLSLARKELAEFYNNPRKGMQKFFKLTQRMIELPRQEDEAVRRAQHKEFQHLLDGYKNACKLHRREYTRKR